MEKKEMTMEARLLLAFVLMGLVLFGTQYFYKPPPAPTNRPRPRPRLGTTGAELLKFAAAARRRP